MNKADVVSQIAEQTGLTQIETETVVDAFFEVVSRALEGGEPLEFRGFGSFRVRERAARTYHPPGVEKPVKVPKRMVPAFRPSQALRERVADH